MDVIQQLLRQISFSGGAFQHFDQAVEINSVQFQTDARLCLYRQSSRRCIVVQDQLHSQIRSSILNKHRVRFTVLFCIQNHMQCIVRRRQGIACIRDDTVFLVALVTCLDHCSNGIVRISAAVNHSIAGDLTGHLTDIFCIQRGIHDEQLRIVGNCHITAQGSAVQIQNGIALDCQITGQITHQNDHRFTIDRVDLLCTLGCKGITRRLIILIGGLQSVKVNDQSFVCRTCIFEVRIQIDDQTLFRVLVFLYHRQIGAVGGVCIRIDTKEAEQFVNRFLALESHFQIKSIVRTGFHLHTFQRQQLLDHGIVSVIPRQIHVHIKLLERVGQCGRRCIGINDDIHIIPQEIQSDLTVDCGNITLLHIVGSQQGGQIDLVCLLRQIQVDIQNTVIGLVVDIGLNGLQTFRNRPHLRRRRCQVKNKLQILYIDLVCVVAQRQARSRQLTFSVFTEFDQRVAAEAVVLQDRIDQSLQADLCGIILIHVQERLAVQLNVGITGIDQVGHKLHDAVLIAGNLCLQRNDIALAVFDNGPAFAGESRIKLLVQLIDDGTGDVIGTVLKETVELFHGKGIGRCCDTGNAVDGIRIGKASVLMLWQVDLHVMHRNDIVRFTVDRNRIFLCGIGVVGVDHAGQLSAHQVLQTITLYLEFIMGHIACEGLDLAVQIRDHLLRDNGTAFQHTGGHGSMLTVDTDHDLDHNLAVVHCGQRLGQHVCRISRLVHRLTFSSQGADQCAELRAA